MCFILFSAPSGIGVLWDQSCEDTGPSLATVSAFLITTHINKPGATLKAPGRGLPTSPWLLPASAALHWEDGCVCEIQALEILPKNQNVSHVREPKEVKWPVLSWDQPALSAGPEMERKSKAGGETQPGRRAPCGWRWAGGGWEGNQCLIHIQCAMSSRNILSIAATWCRSCSGLSWPGTVGFGVPVTPIP